MSPSTDLAAVSADALASHSRSMAHRLVSGAGSACLLAFRLAPEQLSSALAHGLTPSGQFLVAGYADAGDPVTAAADGQAIDVRVDLSKESPEPALRLVCATAQMVGTLTWLSPDETFLMLVDGDLPDRIAEIAESENGRVGVVETDRVLLRDSLGVTPMEVDTLVQADRCPKAWEAAYPSSDQEWDAYDLVASVNELFLRRICHAVADGEIAGTICGRRPSTHICEHTLGRVFVADIDRAGVTLMSVESEETLIAFAAFRHPATSLDDLAVQLSCLIEDSVPAR